MNVKLLSGDAKMPTKGTSESAGLDFYAPEAIRIPAKGDTLVGLKLAIDLGPGYVMIMKEKSGICTEKKLVMGASVVDSDYRGEVHAHIFNLSDHAQYIGKGEKVCQGIIFPCNMVEPVQVESLNMDTERGEGGFGSTGK